MEDENAREAQAGDDLRADIAAALAGISIDPLDYRGVTSQEPIELIETNLKMIIEAETPYNDFLKAEELYLKLAGYCIGARHVNEAIHLSGKAGRLFPKSSVPLLFEGLSYMLDRNPKKATTAFLDARHRSPQKPEPDILQGYALAQRGKHDAAIEAYRSAFEKGGGKSALIAECLLLLEKGDVQAAKVRIDATSEILNIETGEFGDAARFLVEKWIEQGNFAMLENASGAFPHEKSFLEALAKANLGHGNIDKAKRMFKMGTQRFPGDEVFSQGVESIEAIAKNALPCPECGGTGHCPDCNGNSKCNLCKGSGKCIQCNGSGECGDCRGTGDCPDCRGRGRIGLFRKCKTCSGTGKCQTCRGGGQCRRCKGHQKCTKCKGTKKCPVGSGRGRCNRCKGSGQMGR